MIGVKFYTLVYITKKVILTIIDINKLVTPRHLLNLDVVYIKEKYIILCVLRYFCTGLPK